MKKTSSVAAAVVKQAKSRTVLTNEKFNRKERQNTGSFVDCTPDSILATPRVRVIIFGRSSPEVYDFSALLVQEELALFLAEGFRCWAAGVCFKARANAKRRLLNFAEFFASWPNLTLMSINEAFWTAVVRFINAPRKNGQPLSPSTRSQMLQAITSPIKALLNHPEHNAAAQYLCYESGLPSNSWPDKSKKAVPTAVLTPLEKDQMVLACLQEIKQIQKRFQENENTLKYGNEKLNLALASGTQPDFAKDVSICAAFIEQLFPDKLALRQDLYDVDRNLYSAVTAHGIFSVRRLLYVNLRDLVPFIILICIKTAFNPNTVLSLKWSNVRYTHDGNLITIVGQKRRQDRQQSSTNDANDNEDEANYFRHSAEVGITGGLGDLLSWLRNITARTRAILDSPKDADKLFIGIPRKGGSTVKSFGGDAAEATDDIRWKKALEDFIKEHKLRPFTLKMLRATEGESEYFRSNGDLKAVQARLGHKTARTTRTFYTSDWMRRSGQDRIAETQELYIRWAETGGLTDPRGKEAFTRGATTPGFMCLDPYDSPRNGQQRGKLCTAYGECPSCPLAAAKPKDPKAVALYLGLQKAIFAGQQGRISGEGWTLKWAPIIYDLNQLIALVPHSVKLNAMQFRVHLKAVG